MNPSYPWVAVFAVETPTGETVTVASTPRQTRGQALALAAAMCLMREYSEYRLNSIVRVWWWKS